MKLDVRDLRIGNVLWFKSFSNEGETTVLGLIQKGGPYRDNAILNDVGATTEELSAIPITKEWLVKLGFKDNKGINVFVKENYDIERVLADSQEWGFYINEESIGVQIKYVHQLQNLYFALTGKELLPINLNT